MKRLAALVTATLLCLPIARADEPAPLPPSDDPVALKALAARLGDEASDIRRVAEAEHTRMQTECWKRFLVTRCLDDAGQAFRDEKLKAVKLENRARAIQRDLKRREVAAREAKRKEEEAAQADRQ